MVSPWNNSDVAIFGAGNIGRGLLAQLVSAAGLRPVLVETDEGLVRRLREAGCYDVVLTGRVRERHRVAGYAVLASGQCDEIAELIAKARFAATAVGGAHVPTVAPALAPGLEKRRTPLNILVCENRPDAEQVLAESLRALGCAGTGFSCVKCAVERIVRGVERELTLLGEGGQTLYVARKAWKPDGAGPNVEGMRSCDDIDAIYARKLYTNNTGHVLLAYLGALAGQEYIHEAMEVAEIRRRLDELLACVSRGLIAHYGMEPGTLREHVDELVGYRYANRDLADAIKRVARDPLRKLGPDERLAGVVHLLARYQLPTAPVSRVIGAALHYRADDDADSMQIEDLIRAHGPGHVLETVCGFGSGEPWYKECLRFYEEYGAGS